jgi:hypothetical protein
MRAANLRAVETLITRSAPDEVVVPQGCVAAPYSSQIAVRRSATSEQTLSASFARVMSRQGARIEACQAQPSLLSRARCLPLIQRRRQYFGEVRTCAIHHCDSLTLNQQGANYGEYGRSSQHRPMVTGMFRDRDSAERAYQSLPARGGTASGMSISRCPMKRGAGISRRVALKPSWDPKPKKAQM